MMINNRKILAFLCLFILLMLFTPAPAVAVWNPKAETSENNTLPTGLSLPSWSTADLSKQNIAPSGVVIIDNNEADGSEVNTQPNGTATNIARGNTGSETNTKPTGSANVSALTADGSETNTQPSGTVANVARDNDGSEVNTRPSGANDPNAQSVNADKTISEPDADVRPSEQTTDSNIGDTQPTGAPTPNPQINLDTVNQSPAAEPASLLQTDSAAENDWYLGEAENGFTLSTTTGIKVVVDDNATGSFVQIYLDLDVDGEYAEDQSGDGLTNGNLTEENEDIFIENIEVDNSFTIDGIHYTVNLNDSANFGGTDNRVKIKSNTWAEGHWSVDTDNNGTLDNLYFVMIDNNSDDNFDMIVISFDNTAYNDGTTNNSTVDSSNDENEWATGENLDVGAYNYNLTTLAVQPENATDDAGITMDTWYYNEPATAENVWVDNEGSGTLVELYYCIWDPDSDGIFENVALSIDDTNYGEGSLENKILGPDDDESLSITGSTLTAADNIQISVVYDFEVSFTSDPAGDSTDFSIKSTSWYYGLIRMDVDGDGSYDNLNFVLSDDNSDGIFDNLEISSDDNTFGELGDLSNKVADTGDDELLGAADNVRIGDNYDFEIATPVGDPQNDTPNFSITSTSWFTGTLSIDVDGDDATEAVNFSLSDNNSDGVFNVLEISVGDTVYGENVTSDSAYTDNDARLTGTDNIRIGENASQSYQYEVMGPVNNPADDSPDYSVTSTSWWTGVIVLDVDGDGVVDNEVNFCISDSNSNGIFDNLDISSDDGTFGEGTVTDDNAYAADDVRIGAADNVRIGTSSSQSYQYEVEFVSNPTSGTPTYDFRVTSTSWYEGTLSIDVDDDGTPDPVNFCLSDNNSDGLFDNLDISADATYGEDIAGENENKVTSTSDVRMSASEDLVFGDYNDFVVMGPADNPADDSPDFRVRSKSWYKGSVEIDIDGDGGLDNLYITLLDENSDGQFDNYELSAFNDNFGQGTGMLHDNLIAENLAENNDERLDAYTDNLLLGPQKIRHEVAAPTQNPQDPTETEDFKIRAKSWYEGTITLHGGNDFSFVIWDPDSDGMFENLVFDDNQDDNYAGDSQYAGYPTSPVRLPRGSKYAYEVVWFDNTPPCTDATYGANDLVMQPLDTASPVFSGASPSRGVAVSDSTPEIKVNLADQATGSYKFGIESGTIVMKVNGSTVSHTYSGGTVSYTPTSALSDGDVSVSVSGKDYAKNSASTSWSFTIDTEEPTIGLDPTLKAKMTTDKNSIVVSGSVDDRTGVTVEIWVNNELVAITGTSFSKEVSLSLGSNTIKIIATDDAGNAFSRTLSVTRTAVGGAPVAPEARPLEEMGFWVVVVFLAAIIVVVIVVWKRAG